MSLPAAKLSVSLTIPLRSNGENGISESEKLLLRPEASEVNIQQTTQHHGKLVAVLREFHRQVPVTQPICKDELNRY